MNTHFLTLQQTSKDLSEKKAQKLEQKKICMFYSVSGIFSVGVVYCTNPGQALDFYFEKLFHNQPALLTSRFILFNLKICEKNLWNF